MLWGLCFTVFLLLFQWFSYVFLYFFAFHFKWQPIDFQSRLIAWQRKFFILDEKSIETYAKNQWFFKTVFSQFLDGWTPWRFGGFGFLLGTFINLSQQMLPLFWIFNFLSIFNNFGKVWGEVGEGLVKVWARFGNLGFGESSGRFLKGLGKVWRGFATAAAAKIAVHPAGRKIKTTIQLLVFHALRFSNSYY